MWLISELFDFNDVFGKKKQNSNKYFLIMSSTSTNKKYKTVTNNLKLIQFSKMFSSAALSCTTLVTLLFFIATPIYCCSCYGCYQPTLPGSGLLQVKDLDVYNNYEKAYDWMNLPNPQCSCRKAYLPKIDLERNMCVLKRKVRFFLLVLIVKRFFFSWILCFPVHVVNAPN